MTSGGFSDMLSDFSADSPGLAIFDPAVFGEAIHAYPVFFAFVAFWFGCCIGSFLNVCVYRLPLGMSLISPPSHCTHCDHVITPIENIPIFSYLCLRGKCRWCGAPISPRYLIGELTVGLLYMASFAYVLHFKLPLPTMCLYFLTLSVALPAALIDMKVRDGLVEADPGNDVLKMAVFERHHETGTAGFGFVKGFGFKKGAMAQTVAHDAHNLLVAGTNDADMALAANTLIECGGGLCAAADGKVLALVPLPIAGLMNDLPVEQMAGLVAKLSDAWREMGCAINSPYMTMALIPLACLPELRLTNRGLVDCRTFSFAELFAE